MSDKVSKLQKRHGELMKVVRRGATKEERSAAAKQARQIRTKISQLGNGKVVQTKPREPEEKKNPRVEKEMSSRTTKRQALERRDDVKKPVKRPKPVRTVPDDDDDIQKGDESSEEIGTDDTDDSEEDRMEEDSGDSDYKDSGTSDDSDFIVSSSESD